METGGYEALLYLLLKHDISSFQPRTIPHTEGLAAQKQESATGVEAVWSEWLNSGEIPGTLRADGCVYMRGSDLCAWAEKRKNKKFVGVYTTKLGILLGCTTKKGMKKGMGFGKTFASVNNGPRVKYWEIPSLDECRKRWLAVRGYSLGNESRPETPKDEIEEWETFAEPF